jgi:hypothetical protein
VLVVLLDLLDRLITMQRIHCAAAMFSNNKADQDVAL